MKSKRKLKSNHSTTHPSQKNIFKFHSCSNTNYYRHSEVKEKNGEGMLFVVNKEFKNWDETINFNPQMIFMPKSIEGLKNLVAWVNKKKPNQTIRMCGYRHSSSDIYSDDNQILVSMLDINTATKLPAAHPKIDPKNDLQGIEIIDSYEKDGKRKVKCKIGAATCNYHFQDWVHDPKGGNLQWAMPSNVVMTEITFGGSNASICHGAGLTNKTLSDLVTEIEFVNVNGELQKVTDRNQLKAAAGCFGLLGPVTSVTLELDEMEYANFKTIQKKLLALTIPPPENYNLPPGLKKHLSKKNLEALANPKKRKQALEQFIHAANDYYAEWLWFPLQEKCWENCWNKDGKQENVIRYPNNFIVELERSKSLLGNFFNKLIGHHGGKLAKLQTKLMGSLAMLFVPNQRDISCTLEDGIHFQHGIHNIKTKMMEIEIPIPDLGEGETPDWSICQKAWWNVVESVYSEKNMEYFPMRTTLEMRMMGGSDILMAPQHNNKRTCSIEILTPTAVDEKLWREFLQEVLNKWSMLKDSNDHYLNIRPHWAKAFNGLMINRGLDWLDQCDDITRQRLQPYINEEKNCVSVPIEAYLQKIAYKEEIQEYKTQLSDVCEAGGYTLKEASQRFSNSFLNDFYSLSEEAELKNSPRLKIG